MASSHAAAVAIVDNCEQTSEEGEVDCCTDSYCCCCCCGGGWWSRKTVQEDSFLQVSGTCWGCERKREKSAVVMVL